ncbi:hypothetical protein V2J09_013414 [Rumex salicifolius]
MIHGILDSSSPCVLGTSRFFPLHSPAKSKPQPSAAVVAIVHSTGDRPSPPHLTPRSLLLHCLSLSLGPIFSLRFGSRLVVVISSASAAEECFSQNDVTLANRPSLLSCVIVAYNLSTLVTSPYRSRWRSLRKCCTAQIFSPSRLDSISRVWSDAVENLIQRIVRQISNSSSKVVVLRPMLKDMMLEILMTILAREIGDLEAIMEKIQDVLNHTETANPADFVPLLKWIDFRVDGLLQGILDERKKRCEDGDRKDVLVDNLLDLQHSGDDFYDDELIKGLLLVILSAGTATSLTIEWAMSLLLNHQQILCKAKLEIDLKLSKDFPINQSDLPKLPYLQNIISETLRLYFSYHTTLEIERDPNIWDDPLKFRPERFKGREFDVYEFMLFGFGRRSFPGSGLANNVVCLCLASLIHCFDWGRFGDGEVDMTEGDGLSMPKAMPLEAVCMPSSTSILSSVYA